MKKINPLLLLAIGFSLTSFGHKAFAQTQTTATVASPYTGSEFRRWSSIVSDLEATIHLYVDILGFELGDVTVDPKTSYVYETFDIDRSIETRHATFHAGEKKRVLSVVEVPGAADQSMPQSPRMSVVLLNARGRFDEIVKQLQDEDYKTMSPHALGKSGIEIAFLDKDGHLYALYEFPYAGTDHLAAIGKLSKAAK